MCCYLLILFVSEGLLFYTTAHAGSKSPLFTSGEASIHHSVFHSRLALIYEYLLRAALLVLFESADSVIMFGGLG